METLYGSSAEMIKKMKNFQLAIIFQMQMPMIEKIVEAEEKGLNAFLKGEAIGDAAGPLVIASLVDSEGKEVAEEVLGAEKKLWGRKLVLLKARGPGGRLGELGYAVENVLKKNKRVSKIITIDAAQKLEGEKTGSVCEGVGVAIGGAGIEKAKIEERIREREDRLKEILLERERLKREKLRIIQEAREKERLKSEEEREELKEELEKKGKLREEKIREESELRNKLREQKIAEKLNIKEEKERRRKEMEQLREKKLRERLRQEKELEKRKNILEEKRKAEEEAKRLAEKKRKIGEERKAEEEKRRLEREEEERRLEEERRELEERKRAEEERRRA